MGFTGRGFGMVFCVASFLTALHKSKLLGKSRYLARCSYYLNKILKKIEDVKEGVATLDRETKPPRFLID